MQKSDSASVCQLALIERMLKRLRAEYPISFLTAVNPGISDVDVMDCLQDMVDSKMTTLENISFEIELNSNIVLEDICDSD